MKPKLLAFHFKTDQLISFLNLVKYGLIRFLEENNWLSTQKCKFASVVIIVAYFEQGLLLRI